LLEADKAAQDQKSHASTTRTHAVIGGALVGVGLLIGVGAYMTIGAPGYADMPLEVRLADAERARAERPSQADAVSALPERSQPDADPGFLELMDKLRAALEERPNDAQGLELLAVYEAQLGNYEAAYAAQERLIAVRGDEASGNDYANLAEILILAAGGYISPEAEENLAKALEIDPRNGFARFYYGQSFAQTGRPDLAFEIWQALLRESRPEAPWVPQVLEQMPLLAELAGVRWTPPALSRPPLRGPTAEDVEAASAMSAVDRMEMIRGMVEGLRDRLAFEGGPPEDWARLINALGVLGDTEEAAAIWTEAQTVFADTPGALDVIRRAAEQAGVAE